MNCASAMHRSIERGVPHVNRIHETSITLASFVRGPCSPGCAARDDRHAPRLLLVGRRPCRLGVTLSSPEEQTFYGRTLEEGLAWCLVWLMAPELGVGPFRV
jgi:hypothetical protein